MGTSILSRTHLCKAKAVTKAGTSYSSSVDFSRCEGDAVVWLSTTAGSITVTQQVSVDDTNWYDPEDITATAVGSVYAALTVNTGIYVSYTPVLAPFIRFKIVEGNVAATSVNLILIFREER